MIQVLDNCLAPTNQMIKNLIAIEDAYINTNHPDFLGGANAMLNIFQRESAGHAAKGQEMEDNQAHLAKE